MKGGGIKGGVAVMNGGVQVSLFCPPDFMHIRRFYGDNNNGEQVSKPYIKLRWQHERIWCLSINYEPSVSEYYIENKDYKSAVFDIPTTTPLPHDSFSWCSSW